MEFSINIHAADAEDAKAMVQVELDEIESTSTHPIDWDHVQAIAELAIDALEENDALTITGTVSGLVNFEGDRVRTVKLAVEFHLTDTPL